MAGNEAPAPVNRGAACVETPAPIATKIVAIESFLNEFMSNDLVMPFVTHFKSSSDEMFTPLSKVQGIVNYRLSHLDYVITA